MPHQYAQESYFLVGVAIMTITVIATAYSAILSGLLFLVLFGWAIIVDSNL